MCAVHPLQVMVEETLNAEAESVDAKCTPGFECRDLNIVGICFQGDLRVGGDSIMFVYGLEQGGEFGFGQQRGGAASKVDGIEAVCRPFLFSS